MEEDYVWIITGKMTRLYSSKADKRKEAVEAHKKKEAVEAQQSNKWSNQYGRGLSLNNYWKNDKTLFQ